MIGYEQDLFALRSILLELGKRGRRLRFPDGYQEIQTALTENLVRDTVKAASETEVQNESEPTSK